MDGVEGGMMAVLSDNSFVMHSARDVIACGLGHIEEYVKGIERAIFENPGLAFDLSRALIESVCKAVLGERGITFESGEDLPRLFRVVTSNLPLLPPSASGQAEVRRSIVQTLNGLHTAVQGLCELRNQCGFASHGSGTVRPAMDSIQALLAAEAADAIVGFLHRVHRQDRQQLTTAQSEYDNNAEFNEYVDDLHGIIRIFEAEFRPSQVLFQVEPETYRIYLADFSVHEEDNAPGSSGDCPVEGS